MRSFVALSLCLAALAACGGEGPAAPVSTLNASEPVAPHVLAARLRAASDPDERTAGLEALTDAATRGDASAQVELGRLYLQGLPGVPRDPQRARTWLQRAESTHHPEAALYLGILDQSGQPGAQGLESAARWFEVAAQRGSSEAMFRLANAYRAGAGVRRDEARAVALYEQAGRSEHAGALQTLAMAHLHGELGLTPDEAEHRRYMKAAEHAISHLGEAAGHAHR